MELVQPDTGFSSARILVVENEASNLRALRQILKAAGYTNVVATTDPTKVLSLFAEQEPDLPFEVDEVLLRIHNPLAARVVAVAASKHFDPSLVEPFSRPLLWKTLLAIREP